VRRPRVVVVIASVIALTVVVVAASALRSSAPPRASKSGRSAPSGEAVPGDEARAGSEAQELAETTELRQEALEAARAAGTAGQSGALVSSPAAGWTGEHPVDPIADDWEPAVAADPNAPYVYMVVTRISEFPTDCHGDCPTTHVVLEVSRNGGATFGAPKALCVCRGSKWQYDPMIEVVPDTGAVYAAWLNGFNVVFSSSTDHGRTWSAPVPTWGNVSWNDKPVLVPSANGRDVYLSFNGPTQGDLWMTVSHDFGRTWTQQKVISSKRYFFAYDAQVLSDGTVVFSEGSIDYGGPGTTAQGEVWQYAIISHDRGATWRSVIVDKVLVGEACVSEGCGSDFYIGHSGVSADDGDRLVFVYDGATQPYGPQRIFVRTSTNEGRTWSARTSLSVAGENATSPTVEATGDGDFHSWFMQTSNGDQPRSWNVWYRSSSNGGRTWMAPVKLSDATSGAGYKSADGFDEVYGDYGEIAITSAGKTFAVWGEGFSWLGPGGVWFNRQT
jgi:hypothetical protein